MTPPSDHTPPAEPALDRAAIEDAAADWLARREAGLSASEQAEFSQWLLADVRHAETVAELDAVWRRLQRPRLAGQGAEAAAAVAARVTARARSGRRRAVAYALGGLAAAAALAFAFLPSRRAVPTGDLPATVALKPDLRTLPDGSVVELNGGAEIEVVFTPERRGIRLVRGEAHFDVAKDAARPFVVNAGSVNVRAVGTAFVVRVEPEQVGVLVTEGRLAVDRVVAPNQPAIIAAPTYLGKGHSLSVPLAAAATAPAVALPREVSAAELARALAWRGQRVEFSDTPLTEAVALFNRQNRVQIALADDGLGQVRISGIYWADDPEGFVRLMVDSAGLERVPAGGDRLVLRAAAGK